MHSFQVNFMFELGIDRNPLLALLESENCSCMSINLPYCCIDCWLSHSCVWPCCWWHFQLYSCCLYCHFMPCYELKVCPFSAAFCSSFISCFCCNFNLESAAFCSSFMSCFCCNFNLISAALFCCVWSSFGAENLLSFDLFRCPKAVLFAVVFAASYDLL